MERYTMMGDPVVEKKIDEIMHEVTGEIVARFRPKSIILIGSFGRGEGAVRAGNGRIEFISDCDFITLFSRYVSGGAIANLSSALSERLGLEIGISGMELSMYPMLSRVFPGVWTATIDNYDMKYGSRILYGVNYLDRIPNFKPEDIPSWEGIRLIFNRLVESLNCFSVDYLNTYPSEERERRLFFWINKIILACQDALLVSTKRYHCSYRVRNEIFQEIFPKHFEVLNKQAPDFLPLAIKATEYKLNPNEMYSKNVVELWFEVVEITDKVFRHIMEKDMGITFDSYAEFQEKYLRHPNIRKRYYRGLSPNPLYQNLRSAVKTLLYTGRFHRLKSLTAFWTPWTHVIYSTVSLVYFNISRDGETDKALLRNARQSLSLLRKLDPTNPNPVGEWEYLKEQTLDLWRYSCC